MKMRVRYAIIKLFAFAKDVVLGSRECAPKEDVIQVCDAVWDCREQLDRLNGSPS